MVNGQGSKGPNARGPNGKGRNGREQSDMIPKNSFGSSFSFLLSFYWCLPRMPKDYHTAYTSCTFSSGYRVDQCIFEV